MWSTSLVTDTRSASYLLPVKAEVRRRERIEDGDSSIALPELPAHACMLAMALAQVAAGATAIRAGRLRHVVEAPPLPRRNGVRVPPGLQLIL
jgi:hypothetical protein